MRRAAAFAALTLASTLAFAHNRPNGETLHKAGKHSESMATLGRAKKMLRI